MSHRVHLTFREGDLITAHKIAAARQRLLRTRETPSGNRFTDEGEYFVMQVHPEHEYALRDQGDLRHLFHPLEMYARRRPALPDEIGSIMGFRVVTGW